MRRRTFLAGYSFGSVALTGCLGSADDDGGVGGGRSNSDGGSDGSYGGWFEGVGNYDGTVDETGRERVAVTVGTEANGDFYGFAPAAVKVTTGTVVVWRWTGSGGAHNVVAESGAFESAYGTEQGHTFEHTFGSAGTYRYYCKPHLGLGMKGAVRVVE